MLDIVENILKVAKSLFDLAGDIGKESQQKKEKIATLLEQISDCLAATSAAVRQGGIPHGECGKLITYADELPRLLTGHVDAAKAQALGDLLRSSYAVERLAGALASMSDREPHLAKLDEASGKFRAMAQLLRANP